MMYLGIDLGFGANKLFGAAGGSELPSQVAIATGEVVGRLAGMKSAKAPMRVEAGGVSYYVGAGAHDWGRPVESLDYERLNGAPEMVAIFYGALTQYAQQHKVTFNEPVTLLVGMPLEPLTGQPATVKAVVNQVKGWMKGRHEWTADKRPFSIEIADVSVTSQPTGALYDFLLDGEGKFYSDRKPLVKKEIGIVSVGFNTVELMVAQAGAPVQRFTGGETNGVRRLLELINQGGLYSLGELDTALRSGTLDTASHLDLWSREIAGQIERKWGKSWRRFKQIVLVGGGAVLLNGYLTRVFMGWATMPERPVIAIARGLYKLALMQERKRNG